MRTIILIFKLYILQRSKASFFFLLLLLLLRIQMPSLSSIYHNHNSLVHRFSSVSIPDSLQITNSLPVSLWTSVLKGYDLFLINAGKQLLLLLSLILLSLLLILLLLFIITISNIILWQALRVTLTLPTILWKTSWMNWFT